MFCCPMSLRGDYFQHYFHSQTGTKMARNFGEMPAYAQQLLYARDSRGNNEKTYRLAAPDEFPPVRTVGVYDLRDREG